MIALGVICMLAGCVTALGLGGRLEKLAAALTLGTWLAVMLAQLVFGTRRMEPIIIGDVVYSIGLMGLCYSNPRLWLWLLIGCEASAFLLHAYLYNGEVRPSYGYMAALNGLSFFELAVLAGASAWRAWSLRRRAAPSAPVSAQSRT